MSSCPFCVHLQPMGACIDCNKFVQLGSLISGEQWILSHGHLTPRICMFVFYTSARIPFYRTVG